MDSHRSANIVLLDNDERIVELVTWFLRDRGYDVRTCANFAEARGAIAERVPDLLVSDVDLGAESALTELPRLSKALGGEGVLPPTLVVSGFLDAHNQGTLRGIPEVMGTLAKPFEFTELEAAMERALAGERAPGFGEGGIATASVAAGGVVPGAAVAPGLSAEVVEAGPAPSDVGSKEESKEGPPEEPNAEDEDGWIEIHPGG